MNTAQRSRRSRAFLAVALLALVVGALDAGQRDVVAADAVALLGPTGPTAVRSLAVGPQATPSVLLALRGDQLVRSVTGGREWELLPAPPAGLDNVQIFAAPGDGTVAFGTAISNGPGGQASLYRSVDVGTTWVPVLDTLREPQLRPSPRFSLDSTVFAIADGHVWRSVSAGATWQPIESIPAQRVQDLVVSPAFASDRTAYLALTSGDFPTVATDLPANRESTDHLDSLGVLRSTDFGDSWQAVVAQPAKDDVPFRHVQRLFISPTFADDGTLFAFAWGPRVPSDYGGGIVRVGSQALFRSQDRGETWSVMSTYSTAFRVDLALSPTFGADQRALAAVSSAFLTPASSTCMVYQTLNGGADWEAVTRPHSYESCSSVSLLRYRDSYTGLLQKSTSEWLWSQAGASTWTGIQLLEPSALSVRTIVPSPTYSDDGVLLAGGEVGGVWSLGPGVAATNGSLPCSATVVAGFAKILSSDLTSRAWLGCPLEAEQPAQVLERSMDDHRALRIDGDPSAWFELFPGPAVTWNAWYKHDSARESFPTGTEAPLSGTTQRFEGGVMVFLPRQNGPRTIITLAESAQQRLWRETAD